MTSVPLHIPLIEPVTASTLSIAVHFVVTRFHVLTIDVMAAIGLIYRFDFSARNTLKSPCIPDHITKPDVLRKHPIKLFFIISLRHKFP
jgi:hypothetical protein